MTNAYKCYAVLLGVGLLAFGAEIHHRFDARPGAQTGVGLDWATWLGGDGVAYRATVRGMVDQFTLDPARAFPEGEKYNPLVTAQLPIHDTNRSVKEDGSFLPSRSMLMPVVLIPFYALLREYGMLLFNLLQCLLLLILVFLFQRHFVEDAAALVGTLAWLSVGILENYAYNVSPDVFGAVLMLGGLLLSWRQAGPTWLNGLGGVWLGLALWLRPSNAFMAVALAPAAWECWQARALKHKLYAPALGMLGAVTVWAALNWMWYGNPLTPSYQRMAVIHNHTLLVEPLQLYFGRPFWEGLPQVLFDPNAGFLFCAPHFPLALALVLVWARKRPIMALVVGTLTCVPVLLLVKFTYWNTSGYGNRFMIFPSAVSSVVLGVLAQKFLPRTTGEEHPGVPTMSHTS